MQLYFNNSDVLLFPGFSSVLQNCCNIQHFSKMTTSPKTYRVGTLVYTSRALLIVMFWMLLGDLCLQIMEQLPTSLVPLQLRWATASDTLIGFVSGSLPAVLGILLNPIVGVQSDRHRGRLGRRRPGSPIPQPPPQVDIRRHETRSTSSRAIPDHTLNRSGCISQVWVSLRIISNAHWLRKA